MSIGGLILISFVDPIAKTNTEVEMIKNAIQEKLESGEVVVNAWLWFGDSFAAEIMAAQGFDSVTLDLQHGLIGLHEAVTMLQAISSQPVVPLVRVQSNDSGWIMKMLDAGALGIICPMISTREECERFVAACRYPPVGVRSFGPSRCNARYGADYADFANDSILTFAMIETRLALENLEDILSTPGLDAVYVGPNDLALALGYPPSQDSIEPEVIEAIDRIVTTAIRYKISPGIACPSGEVARRRVKEGYRFVSPGNQAGMMAAAARTAIECVRG